MQDINARTSTAVLLALSLAVMAYAWGFSVVGYFTVDEVLYLYSAETFLQNRSLIFDNGLDRFQSQDLNWSGLISEGPNGLTSQYPPATAVLGAGLLALFDFRGFILLNAAAFVGTLFTTRALARRFFQNERLALLAVLLFVFGTFSLDYAFGFWPHMVSVFAVSLALFFFLRALELEDALGPSFLSGLILGIGMLFRIDAILLLPVIGVATILVGVRPLRIFAGGAIGLLLPMIGLGIANSIKFGSFNPISYGSSVEGGGTNISAYAHLALPFLGGVVLLVMLRFLRPAFALAVVGVGCVAVAAALAADLVPSLNRILAAYIKGLQDLVFDATRIVDSRAGVERMENGTQLFWGVPKKALGQSMPWIALLLSGVAFRNVVRPKDLAVFLIMIALWTLPFLLRSWHGGLSLNMRYFLPLLPVLAVLGVHVLAWLGASRNQSVRVLVLSAVIGLVTAVFWTTSGPGDLAGAHQFLPTYVFIGLACVALLANVIPTVRSVALAGGGLALGVSLFVSVTDLLVSQGRRAALSELSDPLVVLPGRVLVYDQTYRSALMNPDQVVVMPHVNSTGPDPLLVAQALSDGYTVFMPPDLAAEFVSRNPTFTVSETISEGLPRANVTLK